MSDYDFVLPWPPTVNHYHQPAKTKTGLRCVKTKAVKAYHKECCAIMAEMGLNHEKISAPIHVHMTFHPKTRRKYDVSNFCKAAEDALVYGGLIIDDHWIHKLTLDKGDIVNEGMVRIRLKVL